MKFFTKKLYLHLQDQVFDDQLWEDACDRYSKRLKEIKPSLPNSVIHFLDNIRPHDGVATFGLYKDFFIIWLTLENRQEVTLEYKNPTVKSRKNLSSATWLYDEIELLRNKRIRHSIMTDKNVISVEFDGMVVDYA